MDSLYCNLALINCPKHMLCTRKYLILKLLVIFISCCIALYCFMIKLPVPLRKIDTELHALFFFSAAAFFNLMFCVKEINNHLMIFGLLFTTSILIEFAQEYSNSLVTKRIHGNFDPIDIKYNLFGLVIFSMLWFTYYIFLKFKKSYSSN